MKTYTNEDLRNQRACYDPIRHFEEGKGHTLLDYLNHGTCPPKDKIWCVTRFLDDRSNRLFAVWCAREILKRTKNPHPISVKAVEVAERFANGDADYCELRSANCDTYTIDDSCFTYAAYCVTLDDITDDAYDAAAFAVDHAGRGSAHNERKKQIEKLKEEIKAGNWTEK